MCVQKNVENLENIICSLRKRFPSQRITTDFSILTSAELQALEAGGQNGRFFYGILNVGKDTNAEIQLFDGSVMDITPNNQIIVLLRSVVLSGAAKNAFFRGYEIFVDGIASV